MQPREVGARVLYAMYTTSLSSTQGAIAPRAEADLEFTAESMLSMGQQVVARAVEHIATIAQSPSCGNVDAAELCRSLREPAPESGSALEPLLHLPFDQLIPRSFTTPGPGYLAYIPGGGVYPAALADFIANTTNRYTGVWTAAPALVQLEANALEWLREWMHFPTGTGGLFTPGGSMATFNAILCAGRCDRARPSTRKSAIHGDVVCGHDKHRRRRSARRYRRPLHARADMASHRRRVRCVLPSLSGTAATPDRTAAW